jgi:heptosyltransferase III
MVIPNNIILSRSDGIGDMVLMLPMAAILKKNFPTLKIGVLGKAYTKDLVDACEYVDEFIDVVDFFNKQIYVCGEMPQCIIHVHTNKAVAKRAHALKIPLRIGTYSRLFHWFTCTKLVKLNRKKSVLHEAQLNIKLLSPLGILQAYDLSEIKNLFGLTHLQSLLPKYATLIEREKFNIIIHPKSQGSSREWPIQHFTQLINLLPEDSFNVFISGVIKEKPYIEQIINGTKRRVINISGEMELGQFISFIKNCDGIVANATGPLHLGAALGVHALGLYPPIKPIHPGRWAPLGENVHVFTLNKNCNDCKSTKNMCACINAIAPTELYSLLQKLMQQKLNTLN